MKLREAADQYFQTFCTEPNDTCMLRWFATECRLIVRQSADPRRDLLKLLDVAERTMLERSQFTRRLRV